MKNDRVRKQLDDISHQTERAKLRAPDENVDQEGGHDLDNTEKEMSFEIVRCLYLFFEIK